MAHYWKSCGSEHCANAHSANDEADGGIRVATIRVSLTALSPTLAASIVSNESTDNRTITGVVFTNGTDNPRLG